MRKLIVSVIALLVAVPAISFIGDVSPGNAVVYAPPATGTFAYNTFVLPNTPGASYVDPVFGETVRRLTTDHVADDIYARNMWWNSDETRYLHRSNTPEGFPDIWNVIDVATGTVTHAGIPNGNVSAADGGFDPVDPNVLYYYRTDGIHKVTLGSGGTWTDQVYWTPPGGQTLNRLGGTLNWLDASGRYMLVRYGPEPSVYLYDRQNLAAGPYANRIDATRYVEAGSYLGLSPDGRFIVGYDSSPGAGFWGIGEGVSWQINHATRTIAPSPNAFWSLCGDHGSFISTSDGRNYMVVTECGTQTGVWRVDITNNAAGLNEDQQRALPNNMLLLRYVTWNDATHVSTMARGDWAFIAAEDGTDTFNSGTPDPNGNITPWHAYRQEILAVNVLTGQIRRLAHHRSRSVDTNYASFPRVSAGWSGKVIGFASNFNQPGGGTPVVDIYVIPLSFGSGAGPVAQWTLNEGSGSTAGDATGRGHTGTLVNGPSWVTGHSGQALSFDGTNDYVSVNHAADLDGFPLSISAWISTATTNRSGIVNKYMASSLSGYNLFIENGDLCGWYFRDANNHTWDQGLCPLAVSGVNNNQWHHVVFVVDNANARLYVDGTLRTTQAWTGSPGATTTTQPLSLGLYPGAAPTSYFAGMIDEVRVYGRALTAAEILALAQQ